MLSNPILCSVTLAEIVDEFVMENPGFIKIKVAYFEKFRNDILGALVHQVFISSDGMNVMKLYFIPWERLLMYKIKYQEKVLICNNVPVQCSSKKRKFKSKEKQ